MLHARQISNKSDQESSSDHTALVAREGTPPHPNNRDSVASKVSSPWSLARSCLWSVTHTTQEV
jgi:hypothetical protein